MKILQRPATVAKALRDEALTERDKFNLYLVVVIINLLFSNGNYLLILIQLVFNPYGALSNTLPFLIPVAILFWGLLACFRANQNGDNRCFIERFVCLFASLAILIYPIIFLLSYVPILIQPPAFAWAFINIGVYGLQIYLYVRLRSLISYVASQA